MASRKQQPVFAPPKRHSSGVTRKANSLLPGAELGDYELVSELASDELLSIWSAVLRTNSESCPVMLLRLRETANDQPALRGAFVRDAKLLATAPTRRMARVMEATSSEGRAFVAVEPIDGLPLRDLLGAATLRRETLTMPALIQLSIQIAETLALLHRTVVPETPAGIVHGDLGPDSIWVTPEGRVRLLPTALGHVACHPAAPNSAEHLRYKAPEQIARPLLARGLDPRADVFTFGAIIWEAFVGRPAFDGDDPDEVTRAVVNPAVPALSDEVDASQGLSYVLGRALSRAPEERFRDGHELHGAFSVLERRLQRGLTAKRRFSAIVAGGPPQDANAALAEAFRRLVGERYRQRREDLRLLLGG
jgi:serine/threonine protein kinase